MSKLTLSYLQESLLGRQRAGFVRSLIPIHAKQVEASILSKFIVVPERSRLISQQLPFAEADLKLSTSAKECQVSLISTPTRTTSPDDCNIPVPCSRCRLCLTV